MVQVYKKFTKADAENRSTVAPSIEDTQRINNTVQKFITLFKEKHLV